MPSATVKPNEVTYLPLSEPEDWGRALAFALMQGYRGKFEGGVDASGSEGVVFECNGPGNPTPVVGTTTDVLVWDGYRFESMTHASFVAKYEV